MSASPAWFAALGKYLNDAFMLHESDLQAKRWANKFTKWWLEQVRNLLAVSAFYFLAQKTVDAVLKLLASFTVLLFLNYLINWPNTFSFRFLPYVKNLRANFWVNLVLWLCVVMSIWFLLIVLIANIVKVLAKLAGQ